MQRWAKTPLHAKVRQRPPGASATPDQAAEGGTIAAMSALPKPPPSSAVGTVDTRFLETLMGYNARRASLAIVEHFMRRMAPYDLRIVDFSVLSLIAHNPGITSRQLCSTLGVLPPCRVVIPGDLAMSDSAAAAPHSTSDGDRR